MINTLGVCFFCRCVGMTQQHLPVAPCSESLSQLSSLPSKFLHHIDVSLFYFGHSLWFVWVWRLSCFLSHPTEWQIIVIRRFVSQTSTSDQDKSDATSSPFLRELPGQVSVDLISSLAFKFVLNYSWSVFSSGLNATVYKLSRTILCTVVAIVENLVSCVFFQNMCGIPHFSPVSHISLLQRLHWPLIQEMCRQSLFFMRCI